MIEKEKVIKGMEQFRADLKPFCGNHADWERFDAGLSMLKEQEVIVRCKDCKHWEQQTGHCPYNSIFTHSEWFCADGKREAKLK